MEGDMGPHAHVNRSHDAALHRLAQARSLEDGVPQLPDGRGSPSSGNASKLHSPANETGHIDVAQASKPISTSAVATAIPKKHSEPDMLASQGGSMEMLNRPKINGFSDQDHGGLPRYHTSTTHHPVHHPEGPPPVTLTQGVEPYKPGAAAMDGTLVTDMFSPAEVYDLLVEAGAKKAKKAWPNAFMLGIMAGLYIGIGSMLAVTVGGAVPELKEDNPGLAKFVLGFIGLPFGLFMVVVTGADLFTGNSAMTFAAFLARKISVLDMLWAWGMSWFANFVGSLVVVGLVMAAETHEHHEGAISIAEHKCENPFGAVVARGIMCNWLVNMALYQAGASKTFAGKFLGVMMPISAFVTMSFDHAVANMALIPIGMAAGADISVGKLFVKNLIPATLGNIIGGCTLVTLVIGLAYDRIPGVVLADLFSLRRSPQKSTTQQLAQRRSSIKGAGGGP